MRWALLFVVGVVGVASCCWLLVVGCVLMVVGCLLIVGVVRCWRCWLCLLLFGICCLLLDVVC